MVSLFDINSKYEKGQTVQATISQAIEEGLLVLLPFSKREILVPKEELDCDEYNLYDYLSQMGETLSLIVAELTPNLKLTQKAIENDEYNIEEK